MNGEKIERRLRVVSLRFALFLISMRHGIEGVNFFMWERTPYPAGIAFWYQIREGYAWALLPKRLFCKLYREQ